MREMLKKLIEYIEENKGCFFGGILGFLIAILILTIGFLKTFFIVLCTFIGLFLGSKSDDEETLKVLFRRILSPIKRKFR